jgi:hypothetical protein
MHTILMVVAAAALTTPRPAASPVGVTHAQVEIPARPSGLAETVEQALASRPGAFWVAWSVPTHTEHFSCCGSFEDEADTAGCRLEDREGSYSTGRRDAALLLEGVDRIRILLRGEAGRVGRVRAFSEGCALDAGGLPFLWLGDRPPAESVALLSPLAEPPSGGGGANEHDHVASGALMAIALHADPSADAALERFVDPQQPLKLRRDAAFWLGQARGEHGYQVIRRLVREDREPRFREHVLFALSCSRQPQAVDDLIDRARHDPNGRVRGQALFWLAQTAARRALGTLRAALDDDPEIEVKKKAVFALSLLPKDEGVPVLICLAQTHASREVRKQAMFWLGQSQDPRALDFFEEVLGR